MSNNIGESNSNGKAVLWILLTFPFWAAGIGFILDLDTSDRIVVENAYYFPLEITSNCCDYHSISDWLEYLGFELVSDEFKFWSKKDDEYMLFGSYNQKWENEAGEQIVFCVHEIIVYDHELCNRADDDPFLVGSQRVGGILFYDKYEYGSNLVFLLEERWIDTHTCDKLPKAFIQKLDEFCKNTQLGIPMSDFMILLQKRNII